MEYGSWYGMGGVEHPASFLQLASRMYLLAVCNSICILRRPLCGTPQNYSYKQGILIMTNR